MSQLRWWQACCARYYTRPACYYIQAYTCRAAYLHPGMPFCGSSPLCTCVVRKRRPSPIGSWSMPRGDAVRRGVHVHVAGSLTMHIVTVTTQGLFTPPTRALVTTQGLFTPPTRALVTTQVHFGGLPPPPLDDARCCGDDVGSLPLTDSCPDDDADARRG